MECGLIFDTCKLCFLKKTFLVYEGKLEGNYSSINNLFSTPGLFTYDLSKGLA